MIKMFYPRCGTENDLEQGYCRQCGLSFTDVRLALQGAATESLAQLKSSAQVMNGGIATLAVSTLIAVIFTFIGVALGDPTLSTNCHDKCSVRRTAWFAVDNRWEIARASGDATFIGQS